MYDIIIIGAGITGASIAHQLAKYDVKVLVLEKDNEASNGVSKANSAIIHAGNDPVPGTLKAKLNVKGNKMVPEICRELNVDFNQIGSLTVAFSDEEVETLHELYERGIQNGVDTLQLLDREELLKMEPNLSDNVIKGLYAPTTGILAPWDLVYAQLENAIYNGTEVKLNQEVVSIKKVDDHFEVITTTDRFEGRYVINAAGLYTEKITRMVTDNPGFKMKPTRGQYYVLDRDADGYVNHIVYPVPSSKGKGVLVVPTIHGNILLGPTADLIDEIDNTETTREGFTYIRENLARMMKNNIPYRSNIRTFSGIRPKTDRGDFIIEEVAGVSNFFQAAGIESPGLASSPAIAEYMISLIQAKETFKPRENYRVYRQNPVRVNQLSPEEANELIKQNPLYGRIICRCESITEGEIVDQIHRPLPATTLDGIKRRTRPGAGRCQGGFCQPLVLKILARELGKKPIDILLDQKNSNILVSPTKSAGGDIDE